MLKYFLFLKRGVIITKTTKVKEIDKDENIAACWYILTHTEKSVSA
jgi:hypothetical protein